MSLPVPVATACRDLEEDRLSGAHDLARRAAASMTDVVAASRFESSTELIDLMRTCAATLARVRPAMLAIANATSELFERIEGAAADSDDPRSAAEEVGFSYLIELDRALAETSRKTAELVGSDKSVLTLSWSRTVVDGLSQASPSKVIVAESRPALEGRRTASTFAEQDVPVLFVSDAAAPGMVARASLVLLGADAVLADGAVVNKVGSYGIALAAKRAEIPLYAACEGLKVTPLHTMPIEAHPGRELWESPPESVEVSNHCFELVPPDLVTGIVTEQGIVAPSDAARMASGKRKALRAIGLT